MLAFFSDEAVILLSGIDPLCIPRSKSLQSPADKNKLSSAFRKSEKIHFFVRRSMRNVTGLDPNVLHNFPLWKVDFKFSFLSQNFTFQNEGHRRDPKGVDFIAPITTMNRTLISSAALLILQCHGLVDVPVALSPDFPQFFLSSMHAQICVTFG